MVPIEDRLQAICVGYCAGLDKIPDLACGDRVVTELVSCVIRVQQPHHQGEV